MQANGPIPVLKHVLRAVVALGAGASFLTGQQAVVETALPEPDPSSTAYFEQSIQPIFQTRCLACHNKEFPDYA